jgi:hypothetical protein
VYLFQSSNASFLSSNRRYLSYKFHRQKNPRKYKNNQPYYELIKRDNKPRTNPKQAAAPEVKGIKTKETMVQKSAVTYSGKERRDSCATEWTKQQFLQIDRGYA